MPDDSNNNSDSDEQKRHEHAEHQPEKPTTGIGLLGPGTQSSFASAALANPQLSDGGPQDPPSYPQSLLGNPVLNGRGNEPVRAALMLGAQQTYGNRALQRYLQRTKSAATPSADENLTERIQSKAGSGSSLGAGVGIQGRTEGRLATNQQPLTMPGAGERARASSIKISSQVQRYEAGEHAQFGAKPGEKEEEFNVNGVKMTYGEMIAMGDLFEEPGDVRKAPKPELEKLLDIIRRDRDYYLKKPGAQPVAEKEWENATGGRYIKLASKNTAHFAGKNVESWSDIHKQSLKLAQKGNMDEALQTNAFGDHFLTDAFSAGHLIDKKAVMDRSEANLNKSGSEVFAKAVAAKVMANGAAAQKLLSYEVNPTVFFTEWMPMNTDSLAKLIELIRKHEDDAFYSNFAKGIHDQLNRDISEGSGGVWVENKWEKWRLPGDKTLNLSPKTVEIVQKAVAQSRQNIHDAANQKKVAYDKMIEKVKDYIPHPTKEGQKQVQDATDTLTDPKQEATMKAWARIAMENVDTLIETLLKKGKLRTVADGQKARAAEAEKQKKEAERILRQSQQPNLGPKL